MAEKFKNKKEIILQAQEKIVNKMTKDGLAEQNKNTGEITLTDEKEKSVYFKNKEIETQPCENEKTQNNTKLKQNKLN